MRLVLPLALGLLIAGCIGGDAPAAAPREETSTDDAGLRPITARFEGAGTGTPAQPGVYDLPFEVPRGAVGVNGTLTWSRPPVDTPFGLGDAFEFELLDPQGEIVDDGYEDVDGRLVVTTIDPPRAGEWTFRVRAVAAANAAFVVDAAADLIVPKDNVLARSLELGPRSFFEINMIMEGNASFVFSFNSSAPVRWDVHSHPPEGLKEWEGGTGTTATVGFTAPARDVYSILWENEGALSVDLAYEVVGEYRLHSHSG